MNKIVRTIEIDPVLDAAVQRLAADTHRTPSEIVADAIEKLLEDDDDLAIELARIAEFEKSGEDFDEEEMRRRLDEMMRRRDQPGS
jgi:predicted transcriptional regulator